MTKHAGRNDYRGTVAYEQVKAELINAASYRGQLTYQDVARIIGQPSSGSQMGKQTGQVIGEINEDELEAGRPMISAIVVKSSGEIGQGFFELAEELGRLKPGADRDSFLKNEREAVYETWKRRH
jgi:hypothetical protein